MARMNARDAMIYAEEALIVEVQTAIHTLMVDRKMNRTALAEKLGVSPARVSQMFSDSAKNLTLRTVARVFHLLGEECRVTCDRLEARAREECVEIEQPMEEQRSRLKKVVEPPDFASRMELIERLGSMKDDSSQANDNFEAVALAA